MNRINPFIPIYQKVNSGTNQSKYKNLRPGGVPTYIDIELTNLCNFSCRFCPTGTRSMQRIKGYMPEEVIDAIVENVQRFAIPGVRFIRWGEPTIHPDFIDYVRKVKETGTLVHVNTNGSKLDEDSIKALIDMRLDSIKFSFQGADEGTYSEMRKGGDYNKLLGTIRKFSELRGELEYPYIQISTTLTGETVEQIEDFKKDVEGLCDYYNIGYTLLTHLNIEKMDIDEVEKEQIRQLQEKEKSNHKYIEVCSEAFDKLSVNWNGDVTLCCADYDNFMIVGNILDNNLRQLFNSKAADNYRKIIASKQYGRIKCCSICYDL